MVGPSKHVSKRSKNEQILMKPAHQLSEMIKKGRLTSTKICQLYIERIKQVQPVINAMCENRFEAALQEAAAIDKLIARYRKDETLAKKSEAFSEEEEVILGSPLVGIPVSVKECIAVAGMINSCGAWERRNVTAESDAVVIKNAKRFGLIPICTTNVPELTLYWADCRNLIYGTTFNPYDLDRVPGASSGGEAALIAAGASVIGIGTDIGGSLRNPAHYSGIMSHKPTPFLVSSEGNYPRVKEARLRMFTMGPLCRYASDLRHILKILLQDKDNSFLDSYWCHQPADIAETRKKVIRQLDEPFNLSSVRFYYCKFDEVGVLRAMIGKRERRVQPEIVETQLEVLDYFSSRFNCHVESIDLNKYLAKTYKAWLSMMLCGGTHDRDQAYEHDEIKNALGMTSPKLELLKAMFGKSKHTFECIGLILFGMPLPTQQSNIFKMCEKYETWVTEMIKELDEILGDTGCIIMPTLPTVAHKHNMALLVANEPRFPWLWNVAQFPVTHVTIKLDKEHGLPFGLSIISRPGNDALTIAVAEEIERSMGGWTPPPKFYT